MNIDASKVQMPTVLRDLFDITNQLEDVCGPNDPKVIRLREFHGGDWIGMPTREVLDWIEINTSGAIRFTNKPEAVVA